MGNKEKKPRKLTEKELKRMAIIEKITEEKESFGYKRVDLTVDIGKANLMAFAFGFPICLPFLIIYIIVNMHHFKFFNYTGFIGFFIWLVLLVAFTVVHELIHGLVWGICAPNHFKSIDFGFIKEMLTPYCTCIEPLTKGQYILGSIMPGLVLGIIPMIIAIFNGSFLCMLMGMVMVFAAGGDLTIIMKVLTYKTDKKDIIYIDHPTECGLYVFEK